MQPFLSEKKLMNQNKISISQYKQQLPEPLKPRTLCFLIKDAQVLLGRKKKGFGEGYWLGIGGKLEQGESLENAVVREMIEEVNLKPINPKLVATLDFYFPYVAEPKKWNQQVCVFVTNEWDGELQESDEIFPRWFNIQDVPYELMWSDAAHWLPRVLLGQKLKAEFSFTTHLIVEENNIEEVADDDCQLVAASNET